MSLKASFIIDNLMTVWFCRCSSCCGINDSLDYRFVGQTTHWRPLFYFGILKILKESVFKISLHCKFSHWHDTLYVKGGSIKRVVVHNLPSKVKICSIVCRQKEMKIKMHCQYSNPPLKTLIKIWNQEDKANY